MPLFCLSWLKSANMQIAVGSEEGKVVIYDLRDLQVLYSNHLRSLLSDIIACPLSGAGIVTAGDDCAVNYTKAFATDTTSSIYKHRDFVRGLCSYQAGKQVLSYSWDHTLVCSDLH
eukprot:755086-Hanusia_phi.AAC.5